MERAQSVSLRCLQLKHILSEAAIVTGGAQGLGFVCARALLEHKTSFLAIFDVDEVQGAKAIKSLSKHYDSNGPQIVFRKVDVTDEDSVNSNVFEISNLFGRIDLLLCFAGITGCQSAINYDISDWKKIFDVNVHGSFLVSRAVAR